MTSSEAIRELEDTYDKMLTPKQSEKYVRFLGKFKPGDVERMIEKVIEDSRYLPRISQLNDAALELLILKPERRSKADQKCEICRGTGWKYVKGYCRFTDQEEEAVERCGCRVMGQERKLEEVPF